MYYFLIFWGNNHSLVRKIISKNEDWKEVKIVNLSVYIQKWRKGLKMFILYGNQIILLFSNNNY